MLGSSALGKSQDLSIGLLCSTVEMQAVRLVAQRNDSIGNLVEHDDVELTVLVQKWAWAWHRHMP